VIFSENRFTLFRIMRQARWRTPSRLSLLFAHDLFGKTLHTFPDHAPGAGFVFGGQWHLAPSLQTSRQEFTFKTFGQDRSTMPGNGGRRRASCGVWSSVLWRL
jgi:hypothetical protein